MANDETAKKSGMSDNLRKALSSVNYTDFLPGGPFEALKRIDDSIKARDKRIAEYLNAKP